MQRTILEALHSGEIIIGDGAMGTTLLKLGLVPGTPSELWNLQHPEEIARIHRDYIAAGAQFITTNTLNCNRPQMREAGLLDSRLELLRAGVEVARTAAADQAWVGASVGSTGQLLEPYGDMTVDEIEADFREQVEALEASGVDFIKFETHQDIEEASAGVRMAKRYTKLPVWCTLSFDLRGRTLMGVRAADAARRLQEEGADIVGANCGEGPAAIEAALRAMRPETDLPLAAQSNAGIPHLGEGGVTEWDVAPEELAVAARGFLELGARILAGCCGTNPAFIRAMADVASRYRLE